MHRFIMSLFTSRTDEMAKRSARMIAVATAATIVLNTKVFAQLPQAGQFRFEGFGAAGCTGTAQQNFIGNQSSCIENLMINGAPAQRSVVVECSPDTREAFLYAFNDPACNTPSADPVLVSACTNVAALVTSLWASDSTTGSDKFFAFFLHNVYLSICLLLNSMQVNTTQCTEIPAAFTFGGIQAGRITCGVQGTPPPTPSAAPTKVPVAVVGFAGAGCSGTTSTVTGQSDTCLPFPNGPGAAVIICSPDNTEALAMVFGEKQCANMTADPRVVSSRTHCTSFI